MNDPPFDFPILGFGADGDLGGFPSLEEFRRCDERGLKTRREVGLVLVDDSGRTWTITDVRPHGLQGSGLQRALARVFTSFRIHTVEYTLEPGDTLSLEEIKSRVCAAIDKYPGMYFDDGAIDPETGARLDIDEFLGRMKARVHRAKDMSEMMDRFLE
jgi:hypothetical protein